MEKERLQAMATSQKSAMTWAPLPYRCQDWTCDCHAHLSEKDESIMVAFHQDREGFSAIITSEDGWVDEFRSHDLMDLAQAVHRNYPHARSRKNEKRS